MGSDYTGAVSITNTNEKWSCDACTFINTTTHRHCAVCKARKSLDEKYSSIDDKNNADGSGDHKQEGDWIVMERSNK
jgi:hypothetical protein